MQPLRIWFDPPHVRWGRVAVTVVVVTALVGLWVAQRRGAFEEAPAAVDSRTGAAPEPGHPTLRPERGPRPLAQALRLAGEPAGGTSAVELVCGLGAMPFDHTGEAQVDKAHAQALSALEAHADRAMPGWIEEMKSSSDARVQAGGWAIEARREWTKALGSGERTKPSTGLAELVRLAERSRDPLPYALAFQLCELQGLRQSTPACGALSARAWAERDPGNALPWLMGAAQSEDPQRRAEYVERALASEAMRSSSGVIQRLMVDAVGAAADPLDRSARLHEAAAAEAMLMVAQFDQGSLCSDGELRQAAVRQQCERLATHLTERSDSVLGVNTGQIIGGRLGWSVDRLERSRRELSALSEQAPREIVTSGCEGLARAEAYFADVAKYGEIGALRRRLQAAQATTTAAR